MLQAAARERPAGSMTIIHKQDKRKGIDVPSAAPDAPLLDRAVANCLCCGKVYRCGDTTNDVRVFIGEMSMPMQIMPICHKVDIAAVQAKDVIVSRHKESCRGMQLSFPKQIQS